MQISFTDANVIKQFAVLSDIVSRMRQLNHEAGSDQVRARKHAAFTALLADMEYPLPQVHHLCELVFASIVMVYGVNETMEPAIELEFKDIHKRKTRVFYDVEKQKLESEWTLGIADN